MRWVSISEFPDYEISEAGDVRRLTQGGRRYPIGYVLTPKPHQRGYVYFILNDASGNPKTMLGHRLVALAFHGDPPTPEHEVAHNDGTRTTITGRTCAGRRPQRTKPIGTSTEPPFQASNWRMPS